MLEFGVFMAVITLAVLAGLNQFYFAKPFRSLSDYISILLVGTGTQLSVKVLVDFLIGFNKTPVRS